MAGRLIRAATIAVLIYVPGSAFPVASQGNGNAPVLEVVAPAQAQLGDEIELVLVVKHAADLAGYETALLFDPAVIEYGGLLQRDNDLKKMGRDVVPLTAIDLPNGVAFGLSTCPVEDCISRKGIRKDKGGNGTIRLATVSLFAKSPGLLEVRLDATKFVDSAGNPINISIANPSVTIQVVDGSGQGPFYPAPGSMWTLPTTAPPASGLSDLTGDGLVDHADLMEVALEWELAHMAVAPCGIIQDPTRDVNQDGCIDVSDLQLVAANFSASEAVRPFPDSPEGLQVAAALTFTVNSTRDEADSNIGDGVCRTASDVCTLRAAIQEANQHSGPDTIAFNIPGSGVQTIKLGSNLPTLLDTTGPTTIDGYTQPGSAPNTDSVADNATLMIQIEGAGSASFDGLPITSPGNLIKGLSLYNLQRPFWIYGSNAHDNTITGSFIGTNAAGSFGFTSLASTRADGIQIEQGAGSNHIGGTSPAERNVISGNGRSGVTIYHDGSNYNVLYNNILGLTPMGDNRRSNRAHGADINFGAMYNIFGGTGPGERNVASGNIFSGMEISHTSGTAHNQVIGNYIGTDLTGKSAPSYTYNSMKGVSLKDRVNNNTVSNNVIGSNREGGIVTDEYGHCCIGVNTIENNWIGISVNGSAIPNRLYGIGITSGNAKIGPGNIITNNPVGIQITGANSDRNTITQNSIYNNTGLGIDLGPIGSVNQNDPGDADSGPNEQLNFPVLRTATLSQVTGTACAGCRVEIFVADSGAGAYGEGKTFVGSAKAGSDGSFTVAVSGVSAGNYVTSTATDSAGNTSEFSLNLVVATSSATSTGTATSTATSTGTATSTATVTFTMTPSATATASPTSTPENTPTVKDTPSPTPAVHRLVYLPLIEVR